MATRLFRMIVALLALITTPACIAHTVKIATQPNQEKIISVIVEGDNGQILGYKDLTVATASFKTRSRKDGGVLVTKIPDPEFRILVEKSMNAILAENDLPPANIETFLRTRHVSCHTVQTHPMYRGGGFAGPGFLGCDDAILIGTSPLTKEPIWTQRGLLMEDDPQYEGLIQLATVPPAPIPEHDVPDPANLTWAQAVPYLNGVLRLDHPENTEPKLAICMGNVLSNPQLKTPELIRSAKRVMMRFANEDLDGNPRLIKQHMNGVEFQLETLEESVKDHLLELMKEELTKEISSITASASSQ